MWKVLGKWGLFTESGRSQKIHREWNIGIDSRMENYEVSKKTRGLKYSEMGKKWESTGKRDNFLKL